MRFGGEEIIENLTLGNKLCPGIDARVVLKGPIRIDLWTKMGLF